jgi:membrane-associated phospholipid phosphatase
LLEFNIALDTDKLMINAQRSLLGVVAAAVLCAASARAQDTNSESLIISDTVESEAGPEGVVVFDAAPPGSAAQKAPQNTVPPVEHTGLETLVKDIISDFKAYPQRESTWVILGVGGAAALAVHPADKSVNSHLVSSGWADNLWKPGHIIGGPVMYGVPVALYLGGRYLWGPAEGSPTNKWSHLGLDLLRAELEEEAIVQTLKFSVNRTRPDGTNYSFPSGHAAATFALAAVLERHLGYRLAWPTLAIATYVATSRLHDNVHYLSDVVFGAAIGTSTGWTVVGRHGRSNYTLAPTPVPGGFALLVTRNPPHD